MKAFFKVLKFLALLALVSAVACAIAVFCFELEMSDALLRRCERALSSETVLVHVDRVSVRFPRKMRIEGLRLYVRQRTPEMTPFLAFDSAEIALKFNGLRLPENISEIVRSATVTGLRMPRVNEGYYIPDSVEFPGQPDYTERHERLALDLPDIAPVRLTLIRPDILGITPTVLTAEVLRCRDSRLSLSDIVLTWPDNDTKMLLDGWFLFDVPGQQVRGQVHGQARQHNIRPLLTALEINNALPFMDAFTGVEPPVDATCRFDVNLFNSDLHIFLDLHPTGGAYRGVPLSDVHGSVDIRVFVREHCQNARITVGPLLGTLADNTLLRGSVIYDSTNDVRRVLFDAYSTAPVSNVLAIANTMNDGTLDCLRTDEFPQSTLRGALAVDPANYALNDLNGTLAFRRGSLFGIPLEHAYARYTLKKDVVNFVEARARTPGGGTLNGTAELVTPKMSSTNATFTVSLAGERFSVEEFTAMFGVDPGDRTGDMRGSVTLSGPLRSDCKAEIDGKGHLEIRNGNLSRLHVFMGMTDLLADRVPGIASLLTQSSASADFTVRSGVIATDNLVVEGGAFSIRGSGRYDYVRHELDFRLRVRFLRDKSLSDRIVGTVTDPLSRMFLQIRLTGSLDHPQWRYDPNFKPLSDINPF